MIDSHCHIGFEDNNLSGVLLRAKNAGVNRMLSVACALPDYDRLLEILNKYPMIDGAFGIHPEYAESIPSDDELVKKMSGHPRLVAVGECGLDYHYAPETKERQKQAFESQIELAFRLKKPIIIHARDSEKDMISVLESAFSGGLLKYGGVLHCFTGTQNLADRALDMGLFLSASGVITFKNADELRSVFKTIPMDRLLIETDSPYLAPVPYRGQQNEPSFIVKTAEKLAEVKGVSLSEIEIVTTNNYQKLFQIRENINAD